MTKKIVRAGSGGVVSDTSSPPHRPTGGISNPAPEAHTPGPWTFELLDDDDTLVFVEDNLPGRLVVAVVSDQPETEANARLIAAAPELLQALKSASHALRSYQYGNGAPDLAETIADAADAAIAKAEGR